MLAAVLKEFNRLVLEDIPTPTAGPGQAIVRIKSRGICATDFKAIKGIRRNVKLPLVPGHEPAGIVAGIAASVTIIASTPTYTMGGDGPENVWHGRFAEYTLTGAKTLFKKPKNISFQPAYEAEPVGGAWKGVIQM